MLETLRQNYGEGTILAAGVAVVGILFGLFAQRSRFCLRAAVIDFWHMWFGAGITDWLVDGHPERFGIGQDLPAPVVP